MHGCLGRWLCLFHKRFWFSSWHACCSTRCRAKTSRLLTATLAMHPTLHAAHVITKPLNLTEHPADFATVSFCACDWRPGSVILRTAVAQMHPCLTTRRLYSSFCRQDDGLPHWSGRSHHAQGRRRRDEPGACIGWRRRLGNHTLLV